MNALPGLICSFLISGMLAMAGVALPVGGPVATGLHYDSFGHLRSRVAYDGTRSLASDYDSGPAVPTREKENGLERTNAIFAKFPEFLAAETTVAEQGRNALGQFTSKVGGPPSAWSAPTTLCRPNIGF